MKKLIARVQAFLEPVLGPPLIEARQKHREAIRAVHRANAEVTYHETLAATFDRLARMQDPHEDWHHFAMLKDTWLEHVTEGEVEKKRLAKAKELMGASLLRVQKLEQQQNQENSHGDHQRS